MDYQKMFESKLEELEKRVAGIEELYARKSDLPDLSPFLSKEEARENYTGKAAFQDEMTRFKLASKVLQKTRKTISNLRDDLNGQISKIDGELSKKPGSDEVVGMITQILSLYDKGDLVLPSN